MLKKLATMIWGKFDSPEELKKFLKMAVIFGLIIGVYWTLRPIKDSAFSVIVGADWRWLAKIISLFTIVPLVILYSKLIDKYPREKVFYGLIGTYAVITGLFALGFMSPTLGFANTVASPSRWLGWAWYVFVESFGSLIVALFWVIATDTTLPESARRGFPIVALFGQLGNVFGPFFLRTDMLGFKTSAPIVAICSGLMIAILAMMWYFMNTTPKNLLESYQGDQGIEKPKKEAGFLEGLYLLFSEGYLLGIFFIVAAYEIIVTVIDFYFKKMVAVAYPLEGPQSAYLSKYAYTTGIVASLCVLFGINNIQRKLGMKVSLILTPLLVVAGMLLTKFNPTTLSVIFSIMALAKAVNYALNQPTLKQLYIPTTKEARYKAQGWIEMFGSRGAKGLASVYNSFLKLLGSNMFLVVASVLTLGVAGVWIVVALYVSKKYDKAIANDEVVC